MDSKNNGVISSNVQIVESQNNYNFATSTIDQNELFNSYETVSLMVASSVALSTEEFTNVKLLYGAWVDNGDAETNLVELYNSRIA